MAKGCLQKEQNPTKTGMSRIRNHILYWIEIIIILIIIIIIIIIKYIFNKVPLLAGAIQRRCANNM